MRRYRVQCPSCGEVLVKARDVTLSGQAYAFTCPDCGSTVSEPATERVTQLLAAHGATVVPAPRPAEPPPLTLDDLITLHELLERDDWLQSLLNAPRAAN